MKHFLVGAVLFLAGCSDGGSQATSFYTSADRARDIQTNNMVCIILVICAALLLKAAFDMFSNVKKTTPEKIVLRENQPPGNKPAQKPAPEEPGTAEEIEDDRP